MEMFCFGTLAGMILAAIIIGIYKINQLPDEPELEDNPENLVAELRAMRIVTGLSRREKEILTHSADYIEKGIDDGDKHSSNE